MRTFLRVPAIVYNEDNKKGIRVTTEAELDAKLAEGFSGDLWHVQVRKKEEAEAEQEGKRGPGRSKGKKE